MPNRSLISLFTGAGGLDLGFEAAGFECRTAVEMDPDAIATLAKNRERWNVVGRDLKEIPSEEILERAGLRRGEADILIGGPPCQPFSKSGYWARGDALRLDDPRAGTLAGYLRVLRDTQPAAFLLENVPGLAFKGKNEGLLLLQNSLDQINEACGTRYRMHVAQLNAADYGVPQLRQRVFVIGTRDGKGFRFPSPSHKPPEEQESLGDRPVYLRAWDVLHDLEESADPDLRMAGKWADLLPSIPEGENYLWHTARGGGIELFGWRRRYWNFLLKLAKDRPSWTIQAQPGPSVGPFHWKNRRLSNRELCRLQTIPDEYMVVGGIRAAHKQIGNAVPSALAEVLALAIREQIFDEVAETGPTLVPQPQADVPGPESVEPVAEKFLHLEGSYSAHPGTGKGYSAKKRRRKKRRGSARRQVDGTIASSVTG